MDNSNHNAELQMTDVRTNKENLGLLDCGKFLNMSQYKTQDEKRNI